MERRLCQHVIYNIKNNENKFVFKDTVLCRSSRSVTCHRRRLENYVCECSAGVDVGDGTTTLLVSILSNVALGCIVLGRPMNVYFTTIYCTNTITLVGMDDCFFVP